MSHKTETSQHNVYVIELDKDVLQFDEFIKANPNYKDGMPCLFVGETRHSPKRRFNYHLVGYKSHEFVRRYAKRLAPEYYASMNPVSCKQAKEVEDHLAKKLRAMGYGVWQHADALNSQRTNKRHHLFEHGHMSYHFGIALHR
jgi:hypothetical protein